MDLPCAGDWLKAQYYDNGTAAVIHAVFPRKMFLRRKTPGVKVKS
jgi:ribosome biogenesis GTPase